MKKIIKAIKMLFHSHVSDGKRYKHDHDMDRNRNGFLTGDVTYYDKCSVCGKYYNPVHRNEYFD